MGKIVRLLGLTWVSIFAAITGALAQVTSEPEALARASKFADQVVRVIPQRIDGSPAEEGFGVVVGERAGKLYIATPYHVAFGPDHPSSLVNTPGVIFRGSPFDTIAARRLPVASAQDDLAVLEVTTPQGLTPPHAPTVIGAQLPRGTLVWNIGISRQWDMPDRAGGLGPLNVVTGLLRVGSLRTPPGASGGAAVTEKGVIGIVLQDGVDFSWLLPIERIVVLFKAWDLPVDLLTPAVAASTTGVSVPSQETTRGSISGPIGRWSHDSTGETILIQANGDVFDSRLGQGRIGTTIASGGNFVIEYSTGVECVYYLSMLSDNVRMTMNLRKGDSTVCLAGLFTRAE
jgi:hypothetical protein